jgi:hypothetical protein
MGTGIIEIGVISSRSFAQSPAVATRVWASARAVESHRMRPGHDSLSWARRNATARVTGLPS